jgi:glycosyltransferase involved in cell wall biosynthesis
VGDSANIVGDTGKVIQPGDDAALANAWDTLLALPLEERSALGIMARELVSVNFELGAVVKRYESFYEDLIRSKVGKNQNLKLINCK